MSSSSQLARKLASILKSALGVSDETLVEYILSLSKEGPTKLQQELSDFPPDLVRKIVNLAEYDTKSTTGNALQVRNTYNGEILAVKPYGYIVQIKHELNSHSGLLHASQTKESNSQFVEGQSIVVVLNSIRPDGKLEFSLPSQNNRNPEEEPTANIGQSQIREVNDLVVYRKLPSFLKGESIEAIGSTTTDQTADRVVQWLDKAAQFTASKISEHLANKSRFDEDDLDSNNESMPKPSSRRKNHRQPDRDEPLTKQTALPIHSFRHEIIQALAENPIIVVVGDTGSGKTTQITQFLHEAGYSQQHQVIACTQPRRLAAISIAQRVAQEMNAGKTGGKVGYAVRFDDCTTEQTEIKYMTDGLLQHEIISDPDLSKYSVIMLDEAHERTISTDVLFALLKSAVARRPNLRVIVTSATLDAARFGQYFGMAPILRIPGRMHPVKIEWAADPVLDYMDATFETIQRIHSKLDNPGDILVFLTGQAEIDMAVQTISEKFKKGDLLPIPVYAAIPAEYQSLIFNPAPEGKRKVVFATNIAETSLTIEGIRHVIDCGFSKVQVWDSRKGMSVLRVQPISQAQANQRSGRAGRTAPGTCYRLYTQHSFETEMPPSATPEIQRQNLSHTVLQLKAMGVTDLLKFDFMDPPSHNSLVSSMYDLFALGAINDSGDITSLGRAMAHLPLDPALSKVLLTAQSLGPSCLEDVLTITAMISMPSIFYRPTRPASKKREAEDAHRRLQDISSDHLTLLKIYEKWSEAGFSKEWCTQNFIQYANLQKVRDTRRQLSAMVNREPNRRAMRSQVQQRTVKPQAVSFSGRKTRVLKALCSGYFQNVAKQEGGSGLGRVEYKTLSGSISVVVHPSSVLYKRPSDFILFSSLLLTSREYIHTNSQIQPEWLVEMAPHFYKEADLEDIRKRRKTETLTPLFQRPGAQSTGWRVSEHHRTMTQKRR